MSPGSLQNADSAVCMWVYLLPLQVLNPTAENKGSLEMGVCGAGGGGRRNTVFLIKQCV